MQIFSQSKNFYFHEGGPGGVLHGKASAPAFVQKSIQRISFVQKSIHRFFAPENFYSHEGGPGEVLHRKLFGRHMGPMGHRKFGIKSV